MAFPAYTVPKETAELDPMNHYFQEGLGYVYGGPLPQGRVAGPSVGILSSANPPLGTMDGTLHTLIAPNGAPMCFVWVQQHQAWKKQMGHTKGRRLAFSANYLTSHGWCYGGQVL